MHTGELYYPNEESIFDEQLKKLDLLYEFNFTRPTEQKRRQALMKEMFAEKRRELLSRTAVSRELGRGAYASGRQCIR
jgi:hypothetical protein